MFEFIDFSSCEISDRHGSYTGNAGDKDGIIFNNEYWIIKYPKSTKSMNNVQDISYVSSPLSEYIGSQIFNELGINTHETRLGLRHGKVVVGCKDFCEYPGQLREMRSLKNAAYEQLSEKLEQALDHSSPGDRVNLNETLLHLQYNPIITQVPDIKEKFWEMAIIDILIGNNDRNNGNWGVLYHSNDKSFSFAPVFDNGNSFMNKTPDNKISEWYKSGKEKVIEIACGLRTAYDYNNKIVSAKKFFNINDNDLQKALYKMCPLIKSHMNELKNIIDEIPNEVNGHFIVSDVRKQFYCDCLEMRMEYIINPAFERVKNLDSEIDDIMSSFEEEKAGNHPTEKQEIREDLYQQNDYNIDSQGNDEQGNDDWNIGN